MWLQVKNKQIGRNAIVCHYQDGLRCDTPLGLGFSKAFGAVYQRLLAFFDTCIDIRLYPRQSNASTRAWRNVTQAHVPTSEVRLLDLLEGVYVNSDNMITEVRQAIKSWRV